MGLGIDVSVKGVNICKGQGQAHNSELLTGCGACQRWAIFASRTRRVRINLDTFMGLRRRQICTCSGAFSSVQPSTLHDHTYRPEVLADAQQPAGPTRATLRTSLCPLLPDPAWGHAQGHIPVLAHS